MTSSRNSLVEEIKQYKSGYALEQDFKEQFLKLLQHPRAFFRDHFPGHITASAFITDERGEHILLTHHAKLNRWLQPGGHADGEEDTRAVAMKEAREETGLTSIKLATNTILDIDIHVIPARHNVPEHLHYDLRYLFQANRKEPLTVTGESHALAWIHLSDLANKTQQNESILRMAKKIQG